MKHDTIRARPLCPNCSGRGLQPRLSEEGDVIGWRPWECSVCLGTGRHVDAEAETEREPTVREECKMTDYRTTKQRLEDMARDGGIDPPEQIWEWTMLRFAAELAERRAESDR